MSKFRFSGSSSQKLKIGESESKTGTSSLTQYSFKQPAAPKATGCKGRPLTTVSNCIKIECDPNKGVFEYEVLFNPSVGDSVQANRKCLNQGKELFGEVRIFDGKVLRLPHRLTEQQSKFKATTEAGLETEVTLKFQKQIRISQCIPLYNMLFDKVFRILEYIRDGKKVFNPRDPPIIPQHKLELWPGYVKSVDELDGGLMLTMDVSHKVLATTTVYDKIREMSRSSNTSWKDNLRKQMITRIVVTKYNNKSYRIDDFDFARSPLTTFEVKGRTMSIKDYYQEQYSITIKDEKQPMIVCRKEMRLAGQEAQEMEILLVPEICFLTGLGDEQRRDFRLMKDMSSFTKMSPPQRIAAYKRFIDNLYDSEKALQVLADWGLKLDRDTAKAPARVLDDQKIIFGGNKEFSAGPKADFTRHAISNEVLLAFDIEDWVIIVSKGSENCAKTFEEKAAEFAKPSGIRVKKSKTIIIPDAKTTTYCTAIREALNDNKNIQIVVIIFPTLQEDRYAAVKKILCSEIPTPSQVIQTKSLNQPGDKLRSIVIKIVLQMNCKLGGALWGIKIPLKKTMIIGIDTYHELGAQSINVGGFVASVNQGFTKYYSNPTIQQKKEELISGLALSMESALKFYYIDNNTYPDSIILFRDGVSDGQLENTLNFEIGQFRSAFTRIDPEYKPKLTFIVVQKRVNSKFYKEIDALQNKYENLPPGTVIDSGVTHKTFYDYYVVSQHVTQGATTPSHYICLLNENEFSADVLQLLTYKLCFMYYNWCGTGEQL